MQKIIILVSVVAFFASCRTARDNKALSRVEANNTLLDKVGRVWEKSNPCVIDTVVQFKNGVETIKYDTLWNDPEPVIVYDTATKIKTVTDFKTIVKYVNKTDTVLIDKTDVRRLNLALADNTKKDAQIKGLQDQLKTTQQKSTKKTWIIVALAGFIVLVGALKFYLK